MARRTPGGIASRAPESESALLKDRGCHREIGGDKTAFYRVFLSLEQTRRDRERHSVAVRLRSEPGIQQRALEQEAALYKAMCKAKDREAVVRMLFPAWSPDAIQPPFCSYNLWTLVEEGRLEDIALPLALRSKTLRRYRTVRSPLMLKECRGVKEEEPDIAASRKIS